MSCCEPKGKTPLAPVTGDADQIREAVRKGYAEVALSQGSCCCGGPSQAHAQKIGYSAEDLALVPEEANLGLGCGNPTAIASLKEGEVVVDLGSGAGIDAFIAAKKVGENGRVIGVDMTTEMLQRSRRYAVETGVAGQVEFREGIIEDLPIVSNSVDVIISNCVINLSPDKPQVFREAFRVLKPGGRIAVSDILLSAPLPEDIARLAEAYVACLGGALVAEEYLQGIKDAGFVEIKTSRVSAAGMFDGLTGDPLGEEAEALIGAQRLQDVVQTVWSYKIEATKP